MFFYFFFFFFKQKTAYEMSIGDWSSDVCSSDLVEPGEPRVRRRVGCEVEPPSPPLLDSAPVQMRKPAPGITHIPGVGGSDVVRDQEGRGREAELGEHGIGVLGQARIPVIERQQEGAFVAGR